MKLIRLKIEDERGFRSLQKDFEINFQSDFNDSESDDFYPYVLAGQNGSGKSNVLEALAEIFYHLDCIYTSYKPDYFNKSDNNPKGFDSTVSRIDAFELEYYTFLDQDIFPFNKSKFKKAHIFIKKKTGTRPHIFFLNKPEFDIWEDLTQQESKSLLPKYVVGYASGNNETLSFPFIKSRFLQFDEYLSTLSSKEFVNPSPNTALVYLNEEFSQAILLSNFLMLAAIDEKSDLLSPLKKYVGIEDIDSFRLIIRSDITIIPPENSNVKDEEQKKVRLIQNLDLKNPNAKENSTSYIEKLKSCATTWYDFYLMDWDDSASPEDDNKSYLYLDFKVDKETKKAFQFHFDNDPLKLFELFQMLLLQDLYKVPTSAKKNIYSTLNVFLNQEIGHIPEELDKILRFKFLKIKKKEIEKTIYSKELSDGEHQLLHTLGLCLLFRKERCLFLFDEPETHFNPDWKARYITSVRNCFKEIVANCEMLITTHSPFVVSDSLTENVLMFAANKNPKNPDFNTFGASVNQITMELFDRFDTIGDYSNNEIEKYYEKLKGDNADNLIKEINFKFGDSVEKTIIINKLKGYIK